VHAYASNIKRNKGKGNGQIAVSFRQRCVVSNPPGCSSGPHDQEGLLLAAENARGYSVYNNPTGVAGTSSLSLSAWQLWPKGACWRVGLLPEPSTAMARLADYEMATPF
jgi:hypothetical protein